MTDLFLSVFDTTGFKPLKDCGAWPPGLIGLHVASDLLIWLAYLSIPVVLLSLAPKGRFGRYRWLVLLFAGFILACGTTHLIDAVLFERPIYRLSGVVKAVTAILSWVTVLALVPAVPRLAASLPEAGPADLPEAAADDRRLRGYIVALLAAVLAVLVRGLLDPILATDHAFVIPLLAVVAVAWYQGFGPGILTLVVSMAGVVYWFVDPVGSFDIARQSDQIASALFLFAGFACALLGEAQRNSRLQADDRLTAVRTKQAELEAEIVRRQQSEKELRHTADELAAAHRRTAETLAQLDAFYQHTPIGLAFFDPDLKYLRVNKYLADGNRLPTEAHLGRHIRDVLPDFPATAYDEMRAVARHGRSGKPVTVLRGNPDPRQSGPITGEVWQATYFPVAGGDGRLLGVGAVAENVTDRVQSERALKASEERYRLATEAVRGLVFDQDLSRDRVTRSAGLRELLGFDPAEVPNTPIWWRDRIHPDDPAGSGLRAAAAQNPRTRNYQGEYRVRHRDGRWVDVEERGLVVRDESGRAARIVGCITDVSERKRAERAVRESEDRFRNLADNISQLAWMTDETGWIHWYNQRWFDYTGTSLEQMQGWGWKAVHHPDHLDRVVEKFTHHIQAGEVWEDTFPLRGKDGAYRWFLSRANPIRDDSGRIVRWFGTNTDVDDQMRAEAALTERVTLSALRADIADALTAASGVRPALQRCAETLVGRLDVALARIWTVDEAAGVLVLQASAGMYTHLDGPHGRMRVGDYKIGRIAQSGRPLVSNDLPNDPNVNDPEWARREGMVGFAGHPLSIGDRVIGVLAVFARRELSPVLSADLGPLAEGIAQYIERRRAEAALRVSERRFRDLADSIPQIVYTTAADGPITYINRRWQEYTGHPDAASETVLATLHPDDREGLVAAWKAAQAAERVCQAEFRLMTVDGQYRWFLTRAVPVRGDDGRIAQWYGTSTDVDDLKRLQQEVQVSAERFRVLTESIPQMVWNADSAGQVTYFNHRWQEYTGLTAGNALAEWWPQVIHPDDARGLEAAWRHAICQSAAPFTQEVRVRRAGDGAYRWFLTAVLPFHRPDGTVDQWIGSLSDIDDLKRTETALRESEARKAAILDTALDCVVTVDDDGHVIEFNPAAERTFGYARDEVVGRDMADHLIPPGYRDAHRRGMVRYLATREERVLNRRLELTAVRRDGSEFPVELSITPIRVGGRTLFTSYLRDITDRKRSEEDRRLALERFRQLAEATPQLVWSTDPDGGCNYLSRQWVEYTGVPMARQLPDGWLDVLHPDDRRSTADHWREAVAGRAEYDLQYRIRRYDGEYRWFKVRGTPVRDDSGRVVQWFGSCTDIDDQVQHTGLLERLVRERTAELVRQREFLDAILDNVTDGIVACDGAGRLTLFNRASREFHGLPAEPLPPDRWADRYDLYQPDGKTPLATADIPLVRALNGERVREAELVIAAKDVPPRTLLANGEPLIDAGGTKLGAVVSMRDITVRKQLEERERAVTLELRRSNEELEKFAYVASHDLQEPLRKIQAFGDRLKTKFRPILGDEGQDHLDRILRAANRMRSLINDLLVFSRVTTRGQPFARVDLDEVVAGVLSDLEIRVHQTGATVDVGPLPAVDADPVQMRQLFQNLLINALKFHKPGEPPRVTIRGEVVPADPTLVRLMVSDAGIGFEEKYLDRIFEVFQRLHGRDEYEGTGVGLAICRKIAERHRGEITARSRPGDGATFVVTLPEHQRTTGSPEVQ